MGDLAGAVEVGRLEGLTALRETLAAAIEGDSSGSQTAALARQLREVLREVAELEALAGRKGSIVDELADSGEAGVAEPKGAARAVGRRPKSGS